MLYSSTILRNTFRKLLNYNIGEITEASGRESQNQKHYINVHTLQHRRLTDNPSDPNHSAIPIHVDRPECNKFGQSVFAGRVVIVSWSERMNSSI